MTPFAISLYLLINAERVTPLEYDTVLAQKATARAIELCIKKQWSHDNYVNSFSGYYGYVGENLARNFKTPKKTHKAFMASPSHKAVLQAEHFKYVGIGQACNITVELFAQYKVTGV